VGSHAFYLFIFIFFFTTVDVYDADSSGSISILREGRQIEADRLHLAAVYQYEIVIESFVLKKKIVRS